MMVFRKMKVKFLAAEALRGVGGLIFDADGNRFANELGRRDYVTGEMWKNKGPFRLCLNSKASKEIEWHCKHYKGRGLMKFYNNMHEVQQIRFGSAQQAWCPEITFRIPPPKGAGKSLPG